MTLREIEPPLGVDALERPSFEAVAAFMRDGFRQPIPDYDGETLRRFLKVRHARRR